MINISVLAAKFRQLDGSLKPVLNMHTNQKFQSISEASRNDKISLSSIKNSCITGKKLSNEYRYAYIDLKGEPLITESHLKNHYLPTKTKKIKERDFIKFIAWPTSLSLEEAEFQNKVFYFKDLDEITKKLSIKHTSNIKELCEGKRSHRNGYKVAYYNNEKNIAELTSQHMKPSRKFIRRVMCMNDNKIFDNCSTAEKEYGISKSQIAKCAKGILKRIKKPNSKERYSFVFVDNNNLPLFTPTHFKTTLRKGIKIKLLNKNTIKQIGKENFETMKEFCSITGVPPKVFYKFSTGKISIEKMLGYEFEIIKDNTHAR